MEIGGRPIGASHPTYIIGEVGSNHNADRDLARRLIEAAAESGVDAVKFQLFRAAWLYPSTCGVVSTPMGEVEFFEVLERYSLPPEWIPELADYARHLGLDFLCTAFDEQSLEQLRTLALPAIKIASPELNHLPLLRASARLRKPLICSTGLCTLADIEEAIATIRSVWTEAQVMLLQCVSAYPLPPDQSNLGVIETLSRAFGLPVGLSDHTTEPLSVPATAVACGARLIEKHFTLSRTLEGPDHSFALEPKELRAMVAAIREVETVAPAERLEFVGRRYGREPVRAMLGHGRKEIMPAEAELYPCDKRSIHTVRSIARGDALSPANIRVLRSERNLAPGLHPRHWESLQGVKASRSIAEGEGVTWDHLVERLG